MESVDLLCCLNMHDPFQLQHIAKTENEHGLEKTPSYSTPCTSLSCVFGMAPHLTPSPILFRT